MMQSSKPNFNHGCFKSLSYSFPLLDEVQRIAEVDQAVILNMLNGHPVQKQEAERVLEAVNTLIESSHHWWHFENVEIPLIEER